jgi:hypothetical protein
MSEATFGAPQFSPLPDGPRYFEPSDAKSGASVSAFNVRVPFGPLTLAATAYMREVKGGDPVVTVSMPGFGGPRSKAIFGQSDANDTVRAEFKHHVEAAAVKWAGFESALDRAGEVLTAGPKAKSAGASDAKSGPTLTWKRKGATEAVQAAAKVETADAIIDAIVNAAPPVEHSTVANVVAAVTGKLVKPSK